MTPPPGTASGQPDTSGSRAQPPKPRRRKPIYDENFKDREGRPKKWERRPKPERQPKPAAEQTQAADEEGVTPSEELAPKDREHWQLQKAALKEKFPEGWNPRKKLSPDALDGIRALHQQFPNEYTTEVLAKRFEVSAEAIRRILKSKWKPTPEEEEGRQERWFNRGKKVWSRWAELGKKPPTKWRKEGIYGRRRRSERDGEHRGESHRQTRGENHRLYRGSQSWGKQMRLRMAARKKMEEEVI